MNIATTLKDLRVEANLTQKELAQKLNIGQSTITQYERGDREPTIHNLSLYANFFGVSVDYLLGLDILTPNERAAGVSLARKADNPQEDELLTLFRELSPYLQSVALDTVRAMAGKPTQSNLQKKA